MGSNINPQCAWHPEPRGAHADRPIRSIDW